MGEEYEEMVSPGASLSAAERTATKASAATTAEPRATHPPLGDLELVCGDLFDRWDKDMRSGKLLTALSGLMAPGYDPRVDRIRSALAAHADLLEALKGLLPAYSAIRKGGYGDRVPNNNLEAAARAAIAKAAALHPHFGTEPVAVFAINVARATEGLQ